MTPRSCISFLAAIAFACNFALPSAQACDVVSSMVTPALIFTVPSAPVAPPHITVPPTPRSMPLKMKIKSHQVTTTADKAPAVVQQKVDYKRYMKQFEKSIRAAWQRPNSKEFMPVGTTFKLLKSGQLKNIEVTLSSRDDKVDKAALRALYMVHAQPLPKGAPEYVNVKFVFENNNGSSCCCGGNACTCANAGACGGAQGI